MKMLFTNVLKQTLIVLFFVFYCITVKSQSSIDINAAGSKNLQAQESENVAVKNLFKEADRYRQFDYNKQLCNITSNNIGDILLLNFFDDKQYESVIQQVSTNFNGRTSITSKISGTQFAYCYMTVSDNTITISAELPYEDAYFFASVKNGQAYISQIKKSVLDKTALEGTESLVNFPNQKSQEREFEKAGKGIDDPVIIDLLIVYTPAAEQWALDDWMVTDILDLIDIALQKSNISVQNSNTGITFNIVYIHLTDYVETNTVEDLERITYPWDGYMDEVHDLRDEYFADEILFIPAVDFTGGVAWLLMDENGFYPDYYAVALSRVQQTSWTYTAVHEIGHNMGAHHHWAQNFQPGPGIFDYSSGWRGTIGGERFCSVMTYEAGVYFDDGQDHARIPYFSSPEIDIDGVFIGDEVLEDNVLTLKRTKTAVSNYRVPPTSNLIINPISLNFSNVTIETTSTSKTISVAGTNLTGDITYIKGGADASFFDIIQTSWNPATGGILSVTFSPSEARDYNAIITFSTPEIEDKVVVLSGNGVYPKYNIIATKDGDGTISPSGTVSVNHGESKEFIFIPNSNHEIEDVLVDGTSEPDAITNGFFVFDNIVNDHTIHVVFSPVGVNENAFAHVKIYSNLNCVYIQFVETWHATSLHTIEIIDMLGRPIYQNTITEANTAIPLLFPNGIYCVRLISQEQKIIAKKVLIVK
jgi:hypothetical protein